ncbi:ferritin-like domain-containing protein [Lacisediminimonas profundi]|uniref:ferritin-like domain-containing protein n=1 Tax=Lacisediminimonas profundi TaxID=2603856 RepID=UPI00124B9D6A|nr:ferritin-like domain-containing protein [Lacisediminimonas profundi]
MNQLSIGDRPEAGEPRAEPRNEPRNDLRSELRAAALALLCEDDVRRKIDGVRRLALDWKQGGMVLDSGASLLASRPLPGRPAKPLLVPPRQVGQRSMRDEQGRAVLIHALAHIEFNAVNLALDAIWRFAGMPDAYYSDWLQVADEEALHFTLLEENLQSRACAYGDFPAHDSLWDMAEKTAGDVLARMALVPRTLEARGLDASPAVRAKLAQAGDHVAAAILDIILRDEIGHVAIGNRWYGWLCERAQLDPLQTYRELAQQHRAPHPRGPFNLAARRAAGFTDAELYALQQQASMKPAREA